MADNLQLRKKQKEVDDVDREVAVVEEKLEGFDVKSLKLERRRLNDEYSKKYKEVWSKFFSVFFNIWATKVA